MANRKTTPKGIIQNRVNGVVKSFESFKVSLKNNRDRLNEDDFKKMMVFLEEQVKIKSADLVQIFNDRDKEFKF